MPHVKNVRVLRVCDLCGGVDDQPRHVIAGSTGARVFPTPSPVIVNKVLDAAPESERARLLRDLYDTASSDRHIDCCARAGCPSITCKVSDPFAGRDDVVLAEITEGD